MLHRHTSLETTRRHRSGEELGPTTAGFEENDGAIRPNLGQDEAGKSAAAPEIEQPARWHRPGQAALEGVGKPSGVVQMDI